MAENKWHVNKAAITCLFIGVVAWTFWFFQFQEREPVYASKKLSEWIIQYASSPNSNRVDSIQAIRSIGTNGVSHLVFWIQSESTKERPLRRYIRQLVQKFEQATGITPKILWNNNHVYDRRMAALDAFAALGPLARSAIPELTYLSLSGNRHDQSMATQALAYIGPDGLTVLLVLLQNGDFQIQRSVLLAISRMETNAHTAFPVVVKHLGNTNQSVAAAAMLAAGSLNISNDLVIPILRKSLVHTNWVLRANAAYALGCYGRQAKSAISDLTNLLNDSDPDVRSKASKALESIYQTIE